MPTSIPLEQFHIEKPCIEDWNTMHGDNAKRFCDKCNKHVHDLSHFDRADADALVNAQTAGHVCVRMAKDTAGRVITRDYWKVAAGVAVAAAVGMNSGCNRSQHVDYSPNGSANTTESMGYICPPEPLPPAQSLGGTPVPIPRTEKETENKPLPDIAPVPGQISPMPRPYPVVGKMVAPKKDTAIYTVQKGDTLGSISQKVYGTSKKVNAIVKANNLKDANDLKVGQKLILPAK